MWNRAGFLAAGSSAASEKQSFEKILCAMCNYIHVAMNSIDTEMSAGFKSCDLYPDTKNVQNYCSARARPGSNSKPSCSQAEEKPQPLRVGRKCFWGGFALSPAGLPASAGGAFGAGFGMREGGWSVRWEQG